MPRLKIYNASSGIWDYLGTASSVETDPVFLSSEAFLFASGDKAKLNGISSGAQVNNISDINATDLTDGGATTLHSHAGGGGGIQVSATAPSSPTDGMFWYETDTAILWVYETGSGWRNKADEVVERPTWDRKNPAVFIPDSWTSMATVANKTTLGVTEIEKPFVLWSPENNKFYMWATCGSSGIQRLECDTPDGTFTTKTTVTYTGSPNWTAPDSIVSIIDNGGGNMEGWFAGYNGSGYATWRGTSTNYGVAWAMTSTPLASFPQAAWGAGVYFGPKIIKTPNCYVAFVAKNPDISTSHIECFSSLDGVTWTQRNAATLSLGAGGTWDDAGINYFGVYFDSGTWYILYSGYDGSVWKAGIATATGSPFQTFTKLPWNPVYITTGYYGWNMIKFNRKFYVYNGNGTNIQVKAVTL